MINRQLLDQGCSKGNRKKIRMVEGAGFERAAAGPTYRGNLGQGLCGQSPQPHVVRAAFARNDGAGRGAILIKAVFHSREVFRGPHRWLSYNASETGPAVQAR
jgi:hypothetical protein